MEYKGVAMRAGDQIIMPTTLHGVDDRKFDDPLKVDFARPTPIHSTFGNGAHRCPGSLLARTELKIFLEEWLKRIPDFRIKPGDDAAGEGGGERDAVLAAAGVGREAMSAVVEAVFKTWQCYFCAHTYDEAEGRPGARHRAGHAMGGCAGRLVLSGLRRDERRLRGSLTYSLSHLWERAG